MKKILIVEDDGKLGEGLCLALDNIENEPVLCGDLSAARGKLATEKIDLLLLDINLPDGSGLELLKEIKNGANPIPVILLTANDTEMDVVMGLEHGADDYITKPFSLAILRARVHAQLRRSNICPTSSLTIGEYQFDFGNMAFYKGDVAIELSKTEQKLLRLLVDNKGVTLSRATLVDRLWTDDADYVDENALSVTIKRLRDKLDASRYIKTVYGLGYVWAGDANE